MFRLRCALLLQRARAVEGHLGSSGTGSSGAGSGTVDSELSTPTATPTVDPAAALTRLNFCVEQVLHLLGMWEGRSCVRRTSAHQRI